MFHEPCPPEGPSESHVNVVKGRTCQSERHRAFFCCSQTHRLSSTMSIRYTDPLMPRKEGVEVNPVTTHSSNEHLGSEWNKPHSMGVASILDSCLSLLLRSHSLSLCLIPLFPSSSTSPPPSYSICNTQTTIVGVVFDGGVVIGADSRTSTGSSLSFFLSSSWEREREAVCVYIWGMEEEGTSARGGFFLSCLLGHAREKKTIREFSYLFFFVRFLCGQPRFQQGSNCWRKSKKMRERERENGFEFNFFW